MPGTKPSHTNLIRCSRLLPVIISLGNMQHAQSTHLCGTYFSFLAPLEPECLCIVLCMSHEMRNSHKIGALLTHGSISRGVGKVRKVPLHHNLYNSEDFQKGNRKTSIFNHLYDVNYTG